MSRTTVLQTCLTKEESEKLSTLAKKQGISISACIRKMIKAGMNSQSTIS